MTTLSCSIVSVNGETVEMLSVGVPPSLSGCSGCSGCSGGWPPSGSSSSVTGSSASVVAVTGICAISEGPLYPTMASAPTVKVRVASVSMLPSNSSSIVTSVSLTRLMAKVPTVTPGMPATVTASLMSKIRAYVLPLRMRVTTLSCSVASVNGEAVEATTASMIAVTGICAVSGDPLYSAMASAPMVKVRIASVLMLPSNSSSTVISVSLTRSTPKVATVTPSIPDTSSASLILKLDRS